MKIAALILAIAACGLAQTDAPKPAAADLTPAEKLFQEQMSGVTLTGFFTVGDNGETKEDKYTIERVVKVKDDVWNFDARIQYGTKEYKATVPVPVKWAGETPVLSLANYLIKGQGVFSARILIHNSMYAGTWGSQSHGGKMFGKIVRNEPAAAPAPPPTPATPVTP